MCDSWTGSTGRCLAVGLTCLSAGTCTVAGGSLSATSFSLGLPGDRDVVCASEDALLSFPDASFSPGGPDFSVDDVALSFDDADLSFQDVFLSFEDAGVSFEDAVLFLEDADAWARSSSVSFILTRFFFSLEPSNESSEGRVLADGEREEGVGRAASLLCGHERTAFRGGGGGTSGFPGRRQISVLTVLALSEDPPSVWLPSDPSSLVTSPPLPNAACK